MASSLENTLLMQIDLVGLPKPTREYLFCREIVGSHKGVRKRLKQARLKDYRADFCWVDLHLIVEVEGGGWTNGRHNRPKGFEDDLRKYDQAMKQGYIVYRCSGKMIKQGIAVDTIEQLIAKIKKNGSIH